MADRPKIVPFAKPPEPPEPNRLMIEALTELLERAKAGDLDHVVWLEQYPDGSDAYGYVGTCDPHRTRSLLQELGDVLIYGEDDE